MSPRARKITKALVITVTCVVLAELAWKWRAHAALASLERSLADKNPYFEPHPQLAYILKPGDYVLGEGDELRVRFHINAYRLRGPEIEKQKAPETIRILCLGGSTTFSTGCATDASTYPAMLERELETRLAGRDFEVLNAGTSGYTTVSSLFNFDRLAELEPDVVVLYQSFNDISSSEQMGEHYFEPDTVPRAPTGLERREADCDRNVFEMLWNRMVRPDRIEVDPKRRRVPHAQSVAYGKNLVRLAKRVEARGARLVFVTFESQVSGEIPGDLRGGIEAQDAFKMARLEWEALREAVRAFNDIMRAKGKRRGIPVIELAGRLPSDPAYWRDFVHLTDLGAAEKARIIAEQLAPLIEERQP